jgi:hypothetical protein
MLTDRAARKSSQFVARANAFWYSITLRADQVRYLWPIADLKTTYSLVRNPIGLGDTPM